MRRSIFFLFFLLGCVAMAGCEKEEELPEDPLELLYQQYKEGEIYECRMEGAVVYSATLNFYDASTSLYDQNGQKIADCNYGWGDVDPECENLSDCEVIYRVEDHISGQPAVDKYGLGD